MKASIHPVKVGEFVCLAFFRIETSGWQDLVMAKGADCAIIPEEQVPTS